MENDNLNGFDYPKFLDSENPPVCSETFPDAFFPDEAPDGSRKPNRGTYTYEREAKQICASCEFKPECMLYAIDRPDLIGIWGGTTDNDRRKIRRGIPVNLGIPPSRNR
jgi:WhiB family redox-sensing transcriptional regulator